MKKLTARCLALLLCAGLLAGCGMSEEEREREAAKEILGITDEEYDQLREHYHDLIDSEGEISEEETLEGETDSDSEEEDGELPDEGGMDPDEEDGELPDEGEEQMEQGEPEGEEPDSPGVVSEDSVQQDEQVLTDGDDPGEEGLEDEESLEEEEGESDPEEYQDKSADAAVESSLPVTQNVTSIRKAITKPVSTISPDSNPTVSDSSGNQGTEREAEQGVTPEYNEWNTGSGTGNGSDNISYEGSSGEIDEEWEESGLDEETEPEEEGESEPEFVDGTNGTPGTPELENHRETFIPPTIVTDPVSGGLAPSGREPQIALSASEVLIDISENDSTTISVDCGGELPADWELLVNPLGPIDYQWNSAEEAVIHALGTGNAELEFRLYEVNTHELLTAETVYVTIVDNGTKAPPELNWNELISLPDPSTEDSNPDGRMAHNIYVDPDLSGTSGRFEIFKIDFKADFAPGGTFWSLCNWQMAPEGFDPAASGLEGGDAYAGFQHTDDGMKVILSFWDWCYELNGTKQYLTATGVYPASGWERFGGEGEGGHYILDYDWQPGEWYRMSLFCYDDYDSRHTIVQMFVQNLKTNEETLVATVDTGLFGSCMTGAMSQFMENYDSDGYRAVRSMQCMNIALYEAGGSDWTPIQTAKVSVDTWYGNKKGSFAFGVTDDYFYGITCGIGDDLALSSSAVTEKVCSLYPQHKWFN